MSVKVRVRLLNNGGYLGFENVVFPVEVVGVYLGHSLVQVTEIELIRVGADEAGVVGGLSFAWLKTSFYNQECEVIDG